MIRASNLSKSYKDKKAVQDLSFDVEVSKVTGFLGPNGSGKSTTMRLMLGLDNGSGTTTFDGKALHEYMRPSRVAGILLEAKAFHPTRSARNHLRILAAAAGLSNRRVDEVLDVVGLKEVADKAPGKFSLGMSQRLGIAAAILGKPKYLLLDEPANGLDPEGIAWLRQFIKDYAAAGNAVFISSHLLSEMSQMADNIVVIAKGRLIKSTTTAELMSTGTGSGVLIRTSGKSRLLRSLDSTGFSYEETPKGILVHGTTTDTMGKLAYDANVPVLELSSHTASLEDVFLELTAGQEEYRGKGKPRA